MYLTRTLEPIIAKASSLFKVVMVSGVRQVGKSTLLKHLCESSNRSYCTLDRDFELSTATQSPELFFNSHPAPCFIDEIQLAPSLFSALKATVDESAAKGQYWISGSQKLSLMHGVSDKLPGRLMNFDLMPMSIYERLGFGLEQKPFFPSLACFDQRPIPNMNSSDLWEMIYRGGWPEAIQISDNQQREWFFESLVDLYISKDVQQICNVDDKGSFGKFLTALAIRSGQELALNALSQLASVSLPTIHRWLGIAQACGIIYLLPAFDKNVGKQLVKRPKLYMVDTGLIAHLLRIKSAQAMSEHSNAGNFFETFVVMEILKSWVHNGHRPDFFYYRDSKGMEIDLLIRENDTFYPIEIKQTAYPDSHMTKWIRKFETMGLNTGYSSVICTIDKPRGLAPKTIAQSIWSI